MIRVVRVIRGEITRLFWRGRRNIHASRVRSPDPCNPCHPPAAPERCAKAGGCLLFLQLVCIRALPRRSLARRRVDSWLASQKRRQVAALQLRKLSRVRASRAIREIRVIRGSLENRKKFSLNPVEGIK